MRIRDLKRLVAEWQTTLNIPEWSVEIKHGTKSEMDDCVGLCYFSAEELAAVIYLKRGEGELTVIHELLHLVMDGNTTYDPKNYDELHERAINRIAAALYRAKYGETT